MSSWSMYRGKMLSSKSDAICEGPRGVARDSMHGACGPPYHSSIPASAPYSCRRSHIAARLRTSPSSQIRADTREVSSDSGWIEQYSVQHAPQPPSAFMPR